MQKQQYQDNQFFKTYFSTIDELGFTESAFYSLLADRMQSSLKNHDRFTDDDGTYIIYPLDELMTITKFSKSKITRIMNKLKNAGYVVTKRPYGRANLIYLPKFNDINSSIKMNHVESSKQAPNHTESKQNNKSKIYTVNTEKHELDKPSKIYLWKQAVIGKIGFTEQTANLILEQAKDDLNVAYKLVKVITNARNSVVKENGLKRSKATDFKTNVSLAKGIGLKLKYVFHYLPKDIEEQTKYLMKAFKQYFLEEFGVKKDVYVDDGHNSLTNEKSFASVPDWMNEKYDPDKNKLDPKVKAELDRKMAELKAMPCAPIEQHKVLTIY